MHGRGTEAARASKRAGPGTGRVGYLYLHTALDDYSRLAYTEALDDERGTTAAGFWLRSAAFFAEHGIHPIRRVLTNNGACYRLRTWAAALNTTGTAPKRTRPHMHQRESRTINATLFFVWADGDPTPLTND